MTIMIKVVWPALDLLLQLRRLSILAASKVCSLALAEKGRFCASGTALLIPDNRFDYRSQVTKNSKLMANHVYINGADNNLLNDNRPVQISGRLQEVFKIASGEYVAPAPIEAQFMQHLFIDQVCVMGNNLPQAICLLILSDATQTVALTEQRSRVIERLADILHNINANLASHQQIGHILVMPSSWIVDNGLLTPMLKVKRDVLEKRFDRLIHADYQDKVVFVETVI
jgi:long-chain acyl-CoA synthetase